MTSRYMTLGLAGILWACCLLFVCFQSHSGDLWAPYHLVVADELAQDDNAGPPLVRVTQSNQFQHAAQTQPVFFINRDTGWLPMPAAVPYFVPAPLAPPWLLGLKVPKAVRFGWLHSNLLYRGRLTYASRDPAENLG